MMSRGTPITLAADTHVLCGFAAGHAGLANRRAAAPCQRSNDHSRGHHSRAHLGSWRGLLPTGRLVQFALCGIYTFDEEDRLAGEKIYYDRAMVLRQLGVFHEPESVLGRINAVLMHPLTMARIIGRIILKPA